MKELKILLVDDEEEFVSTLAERLQFRNIPTLMATTGDDALRLAESERPSVVVLDVMMPGMGGLEVLQRLKKRYPDIQIILLTGRSSTKDGIQGMRLGAFDYLMKPIKIEELIDKMNEALAASEQGSQ